MFDADVAMNFEIYRLAVLLKLFVLAFNIIILFNYINSDYDLKKFINYFIPTINIVGICYLVQIAVFFTGTLPYGSFSPAGWVEFIVPSFGATSMERGHLGKFFVPLFPLFLYAYKVLSYKKSFALYLIIALQTLAHHPMHFYFFIYWGCYCFFIKNLKI